jgi:galactose mutarotase-like enzyme
MVAEITAAGFSGERFTASQTGAACADWYTSAAGGLLGLPDVRITLRTTDGALVLIRYTGRISTPTGPAAGATAIARSCM